MLLAALTKKSARDLAAELRARIPCLRDASTSKGVVSSLGNLRTGATNAPSLALAISLSSVAKIPVEAWYEDQTDGATEP
jgi:hypothetical protein